MADDDVIESVTEEVYTDPEEGVDEIKLKGTSLAQTIFNIVKNIVGEGMLSLPAGIAAGSGLIIGIIITTLFGGLLGYTFSLMGRMCHITGKKTHKGCGEVLSGPIFAEFMAVVCMVKTAFTCISYAIVIGESLSHTLHFFDLEGPLTTRSVTLMITVVVVLLPLILQRDLSLLSYTSLIGVLGELIVLIFMTTRYLDGSYQPGGKFYNSTLPEHQPSFPEGVDLWGVSITTFVLFGSLSTAFLAHYNAPKFYSQLRRHSPERFNISVGVAFLFSYVVYVWVMIVGYLTFGSACNGLILNNYSDEDPGAVVARIAILVAVVFGFPLSFTGLRDNTISTFGLDGYRKRVFFFTTVMLLVPITTLGCAIDSLGLVNSLGGALMGSTITLIFPGLLCYMAFKQGQDKNELASYEKWGALVLVVLGAILVTFGSTISIMKAYFPEKLEKN